MASLTTTPGTSATAAGGNSDARLFKGFWNGDLV
jgi:hypothetical protein